MNVCLHLSLQSMVFVRLKTVLRLMKKVVTDAYKITKPTKMALAHHMTQTVSPGTFMKSALAVNKDFTLIKLQDVK